MSSPTLTTAPTTPTRIGRAPTPGRSERALGWARRAPLMPALIFMIIVTQLPFVATLVISFTQWNALSPQNRKFTGLSNYATVLTDPMLRKAVLTTVELTLAVVVVSLLLGLGLALLLDRKFKGRGIVRTMLITPFLIVPVASALLWKHAMYNATYGVINGVLNWVWQLFGSHNAPQPDWVSKVPLMSIEASLVWQWTPFMMLILLAGLQSRQMDAVEAATVDGAGPFQVFRYLTLPHLRRYLELAALLGCVYVVQNFDAVFTLTSGGLGTGNLPYTIYQTFYEAHDYGQASAEGVVVVIASIIVATLALRTVSSLLSEEAGR
ncbi:carbohydrate ABC transporter permease [Streptantibioticus silvisoli]